MKRFVAAVASGILTAGFLATSVLAETNAPVVTVSGEVAHPYSFSASDLQTMRRVTAKAQEKKGGDATYEGVSLYDVVNKAEPKFSEHCCSNAVNFMVIVKAADHYQAAFALPELDPKFGHQTVLLADHREGQLLDLRTGPLEVIVPEDKVYGRWVRQVNAIEVLPVGAIQASPK